MVNNAENPVNKKIVYTVNDIQNILGIGKNQAYDLVRSDVFPVRKIHSKYVIPIKTFEDWLYNMDNKAV